MATRNGNRWVARVRTVEGQVTLGSYHSRAEAEKIELQYKVANGVALTPRDGSLKSWQTRRMVGLA